jgi:hypothetical protein
MDCLKTNFRKSQGKVSKNRKASRKIQAFHTPISKTGIADMIVLYKVRL